MILNKLIAIKIKNYNFPFLYIVTNKNAEKVVSIFDELESKLGLDKFSEVFPSILTDRNPCFADILGIEFFKETGIQRTYLFFCDAFKSNQKASVENMNKQIRRFFPKGKSIDHLNQDDIKHIHKIIIESPLFSLDGRSPKETFISLYGQKAFDELFD